MKEEKEGGVPWSLLRNRQRKGKRASIFLPAREGQKRVDANLLGNTGMQGLPNSKAKKEGVSGPVIGKRLKATLRNRAPFLFSKTNPILF